MGKSSTWGGNSNSASAQNPVIHYFPVTAHHLLNMQEYNCTHTDFLLTPYSGLFFASVISQRHERNDYFVFDSVPLEEHAFCSTVFQMLNYPLIREITDLSLDLVAWSRPSIKALKPQQWFEGIQVNC